MCGLTGFISAHQMGLSEEQKQIVTHAMFLNQLRGNDSTGVVLVNNKNDVQWTKCLGGVGAMYGTDDWKQIYANAYKDGKIFLSHGRSATKGSVKVENAHPFFESRGENEGGVLLMHNGTLWDFQDLPGRKDHDVDSQWLAHCIAKYGYKEALGKINGPIATMWWDIADDRLYIYRNNERPLNVVRDKKGNVYINSEVSNLMYLKHHFGLKYEFDDVNFFAPGHVYILDPKQGTEFIAKEKIEKIDPPKSQSSFYGQEWEDWVQASKDARRQSGVYQHPANDYSQEDPFRRRAGRVSTYIPTVGSIMWWREQPRDRKSVV